MRAFKKGDVFHVNDYRNGCSYKAEATDDFVFDDLKALKSPPAILVDGCAIRDGSRLNPGDPIPGMKGYIALDSIGASGIPKSEERIRKIREKRKAADKKSEERLRSLEDRVAALEKRIPGSQTAYESR